jgi:ADP-ribosylglycohydrolase
VEISAVTHDGPRCTASCAAYNEIAAALLAGAKPADAVQVGEPAVREAVELGQRTKPADLAATEPVSLPDRARGYVLDSLTLAVAALLDPRPLPEVLIDIVRIGHDTDINAAIAGGLLGVRDGASAIPDRWLAVLQFRDEFLAAAEALSQR